MKNELEFILQTLSTLQDCILKKEWEKTAMAQEIVELKKQVTLLEDRLNENQKQLHEKVDWYSNQLMKCDKQKEALEGEVLLLKSENEALKNDAIKQDKELGMQENLLRQIKAALEVAEMKIAEVAKEQFREKKMWEIERKEKVEQCDQLRREMSMQEQHWAELLKEKDNNEVKQQHEMTLLLGELETLNRELQKDFEMKLIKLEGEKMLNLEKVQQLEKELQAAKVYADAIIEKIEDDKKNEIARLKEQIQVYELKVVERDNMIEQFKHTFKSERKYFKSDKEDEELCNNVSKLVEFFTGHIGVNMQSEYLDTKIKQLELKVEQLTDENKELHIRLGTHQSPTASLMPSSIIVLREALQLNEAESNGLKEEIACLKVDLETYEGHCKRQSEAIVKLKEELDSVKVGCGSMCFILVYINMHSTVMQIHE